MSPTKNDNLIDAVQLIDRHKYFIHKNLNQFFLNWGITNGFQIKELQFIGSFLIFSYLDMLETEKKMQVPLFDYVKWRAAC